jgi:SMI1 / KNR4 family (SUKH-1)
MTIEATFRDFLKEFQIKGNKPVSEAQLAKAEAKLGFVLPVSLRACYRICDGGQAQSDQSRLHIFSLTESLEYGLVTGILNTFWSFFPFAENNDSNPICVCCKSPLAGYVVQVNHDDDQQLKYRSLLGFLQGAIGYVQGGQFLDTHEMLPEFTSRERTEHDRSIASQLIDSATQRENLDDQESIDALRFACDLLSDEEVDEIVGLLKFEAEYVREHVIHRLKGIAGAKAKNALHQLEADFDAFVERCARTLQQAAIQASVHAPYGKKSIRIDPGPIWLNLELFYSERNRPDFEYFLLERARYFLSQKKK